jgi:hypothetical protein
VWRSEVHGERLLEPQRCVRSDLGEEREAGRNLVRQLGRVVDPALTEVLVLD